MGGRAPAPDTAPSADGMAPSADGTVFLVVPVDDTVFLVVPVDDTVFLVVPVPDSDDTKRDLDFSL